MVDSNDPEFWIITGFIFLIGLAIGAGGLFGLSKISGASTAELENCPVRESGNTCLFQPKEAKFEKEGKDITENGFLGGDAKLTNTLKNLGESKALFNLHARCETLNENKDVYSGWEYISPKENKKFTAGMNTGIGEDWKCFFVEIQSIDIENSCKLTTI